MPKFAGTFTDRRLVTALSGSEGRDIKSKRSAAVRRLVGGDIRSGACGGANPVWGVTTWDGPDGVKGSAQLTIASPIGRTLKTVE